MGQVPSLWLWVGLILLLQLCPSGRPQPHPQDNEVRRTQSDNRIVRRERPSNSANNNNNNTGDDNVTALVALVDRSCPIYCGDQTQYNSICQKKGCAGWKPALRDSCFTTCSGVEHNYRENYACQVGCSRAVEDYYLRLTSGGVVTKAVLDVGEPPTLISGSLKSTSLRLSWEGPGQQRSLPYLAFSVQRRRSGGPLSLWETLQSPINQTSLNVISLKPYTQYQFRVGWILATDFEPFYSRESNPIQTLAKGLPSAPEITSIQPISNTSVAVTWVPPTQPNGRLVAYILKLQAVAGHQVIKEIPIAQNPPRGYTFSGLLPVTNYSLALSAQNLEGEGDSTNVHFVTPQSLISNEVSKSPEARLLIQGSHSVYTQPLDLLMEPDFPFFSATHNITGVAVHIKRNLVFLATSEGEVRRTSGRSTPNSNESMLLISKDRLELEVAHLSVDWLHNKLYIVGVKRSSSKWIIKRCDLEGNSLTTVYTDLPTRPLQFAADPFTGYLYWVLPPSQYRGGLFKLDLVAENFPTGPMPQLVKEDDELGPFTLDVANYRILIIHRGRNTVLSVSLDGDVTDIRANTQSPQWLEAVSLSYYNGVLFWTTPTSIGTEEYNSALDSYYQNSFDVPKPLQPLGGVVVLHPDTQPMPLPMAPPQQLQVLYGQTRARITWRPPPPISALGAGAWCQWSYQVRVSDNRSYANITETEFTIEGLRPSTSYSVQVLAYSGGRGPSTPPNRGKTLRETAYNITFLWGSANGGLYATDTLGEDLQLVTTAPVTSSDPSTLTPATWKGARGDLYMASLTWYESTVFFALSNGSVFYYVSREEQLTSAKPAKEGGDHGPLSLPVFGISFAQSIAFDYIGQRIYWSNPKQQTIYRCSLVSGGGGGGVGQWGEAALTCVNKERLQLVTMAREIAVDSYKGLLLWSTGHSIEMSRMNGYGHGTLFQNGLFSGKQIMGLTLNTDQSKIYYITRSASGSSLESLVYTIRGPQSPWVIGNYDDTSITGPIRYFNDRLLWLQGSSEAVITDLNGHGKSSLKLSTLSNITNVHVKDQGALRYPGGVSKTRVQVNPDPVPKWSVDITGRWSNFTLSWMPINNTNFGEIFYEVMIDNVISRFTKHSNITVENSTMFKPYTEIDISITALTYWSSAKATLCRRRTPAWKPSEPLNPRAYLHHLPSFPYSTNSNTTNHSHLLHTELRWDAPLSPNGLVLGYMVQCWKGPAKVPNCLCDVNMAKLSCELKLPPSGNSNSTQYHFAVQAYTSEGAGALSKTVLVDTGYNSPLPKLLLAGTGGIEVLDIDRNHLQPIPPQGHLNPVSANFLALDKTVFWFNEEQDLLRAKSDSGAFNKSKSRILSLSGDWEASHLTIDWIGRKLFWGAEAIRAEREFKYAIMSLDLASLEVDAASGIIPTAQVVVNSKTPIKSVAFNPFRNALYWTTAKRNGALSLYTGEGSTNFTARPFLMSRHLDSDMCNCSHVVVTGDPVAFDPTGPRRTLLFISQGSLWSADETGCTCVQIVNITLTPNWRRSSFPFQSIFSLAGDLHHVYWSGGGGYVAATEKRGGGVTDLLSSGVRELRSFGPSAQPFPDSECLIPKKMQPEEPLLFNHSSHSLHLNLPSGLSANCSLQGLSLPTPHYSVYYGTVDETPISKCTPTSPSHCKVVKTLERSLHITDLHPYTTYTLFVTLTNHYAKMVRLPPLLCNPIMLRTAPGAPMPPKLLRLEALTPSSIRVVWGQPEKLNGEKVWYEVHWKTSGSASFAKWAETESQSNSQGTEFYLELNNLTAALNYTVWVRAFSEKGDFFSDSPGQNVATFPNPSDIQVVSVTPHRLSLLWNPPNDTSILRHQITYREASSADLKETPLVTFTIPGRPYTFSLQPLKPRTLYVLRIRTWYNGDPLTPFIYPPTSQQGFHFYTQADKPSPPAEPPVARGIGKALYEVTWKEAVENGGAIQVYSLEARLAYNYLSAEHLALYNNETFTTTTTTTSPAATITSFRHVKRGQRLRRELIGGAEKRVQSPPKLFPLHWVVVYNGTDTRWVVDGLDVKSYYLFRVRAKNSYGWGPYSNESVVVSLAELTLVAEPQSVGIIIGMISLSFILLGLFGVLFYFVYKRKQNEKPALQNSVSSERREVELATLRELPGGTSFVHQSNILYAGSDLLLDLDLVGVPKVNRNQIICTHLLGKGAFGEVYEGIAMNLRGSGDPEIRVAIKTLQKGKTQNEKLEFIEEAKLMAQFRHPNIIQLLGICVDTDPCCLLLELMGDGDLLSYLRSNRPGHGLPPNNGNPTAPLNLVDLLLMCVDVAKGCVYLEEMHFVHRDLAARNCLVSFVGEERRRRRLVKIGDFGLARDIYKHDYYRKDGEALLPVRWMAPESLVDGIFTTQTDVWAFGVLLWEIMTLGQQPYPARSNIDVWNYVGRGGRLQRPPHCPHVLGNLMLQCWEYAPENRPSFKDCWTQLDLILQDFHDSQAHSPAMTSFPPLHDVHFDPYSYAEGSGGGSGHYTQNPQQSQHQRQDSDSVFLPQTEPITTQSEMPLRVPNYLEVLSEQESSPHPSLSINDEGYEIPLPKRPPRSIHPHRAGPPPPPITTEIGLPSPTYWNAETLPLRSTYRHLLASSTSEDADTEELEQDQEQDHPQDHCSRQGHLYYPNTGVNRGHYTPTHLRGIACQYSSHNQQPSSYLFNNHMYAAQNLNSGGSGGALLNFQRPLVVHPTNSA